MAADKAKKSGGKAANSKNFKHVANALKVLGHRHRLQIVRLLTSGKKYTVGELATALGIVSQVTSEHLTLLTKYGYLAREPEGQKVYYKVVDPTVKGVLAFVDKKLASG